MTETMRTNGSVSELFNLNGRVAIVTGGAGMLGLKHAEAIAEMGGIPVLVDLQEERCKRAEEHVRQMFGGDALGMRADITVKEEVRVFVKEVMDRYGRIDILINNAGYNPKVEVEGTLNSHWSRLEQFPLESWHDDITVGLTGAFLCSQTIGDQMARRGKGVILNIVSDLGVIAPDQRIYRQPGVPDEEQPVKAVSYSVVKHGLIGLTRYLATYWANRGVRANALSPGGVYTTQDEAFVKRLVNLIPLGRMACQSEYKAAVVFLVSDASSFMTGANLIVDGGRTAW